MEIEIKIDIPKRAMDAIRQYCSINNLNLEEYLSYCIVTQNNIDRYGDLNDRYKEEPNVSTQDEIPKEEINNYVVNYKAEFPETDKNEKQTEKTSIIKQEDKEIKAEEAVEEVKPKTRRRRTIKAK